MAIRTFSAIREAASDGRIFSLVFIKRDGTLRTMKCRTGVKAYRKSLFTPVKELVNHDYITVFDMDKKEYRSFYQSSVLAVTMNKETYHVLG